MLISPYSCLLLDGDPDVPTGIRVDRVVGYNDYPKGKGPKG